MLYLSVYCLQWRGQVFDFGEVDINSICVRDIKMMVSEETGITSKRIKLIGVFGGAGTSDNDVIMLNQFEKKIKKGKIVVSVMGTPDEELAAFEQGAEPSGTEGVLNDFNHNFTPASKEWHNLKRFTDSLEINFIQEPRPGKKLLVLDLDHTILDFSSRENVTAEQMKRPFMDFFLETMYESYDIAIWSQTVGTVLLACLYVFYI
jgi:ubiquitin-like domain-containing CTD phosphatase 1